MVYYNAAGNICLALAIGGARGSRGDRERRELARELLDRATGCSAGGAQPVEPGRCCPPRLSTYIEPSFLEFNGIL